MGDPVTQYALISGLFNFAGGLAGGGSEGATLNPIGRIPLPGGQSADPAQLIGLGVGATAGLGSRLAGVAEQPITLRGAYAQQPPVFTGGGLPFPIGVTGQDPALASPNLTSLQPRYDLTGLFDLPGSNTSSSARQGPTPGTASRLRRTGTATPRPDLITQSTAPTDQASASSDADQALGALDLLRQLAQPRR